MKKQTLAVSISLKNAEGNRLTSLPKRRSYCTDDLSPLLSPLQLDFFCIVTRFDDRLFVVRFFRSGKDFTLFREVKSVSMSQSSTRASDTASFTPWIKRPGHQIQHS
jgi:hypothetical protein